MENNYKTKTQLMNELTKLRLKVDKLKRLKPGQKKAGGKFNNAEQIYQKLIEEANDAIVSINEEGVLIAFNKKAEELLGYAREEILGKPITLLAHPRHQEGHGKMLEKLKKTHNLDFNRRAIEGTGITKNGQEIPLELSYYTIEANGKRIITAIIRNITERKKAEEEIRKFKTIADQALYGVAMVDLEGNLIYLNESCSKMHGYTVEELIGKHVSTFHTEELEPLRKLNVQQLMEKGSFVGKEVLHKRKDNTIFPTLMSATVINNSKGEPLFLTTTAVDITDLRLTQDTLRNALNYLENIIECSLDAIVTTDTKGYVTSANKSFLRLLRSQEEEIVGKHMIDFAPIKEGPYESTTGEFVQIDKDFLDDAKKWISRLVREGKISNMESYHIRTDKKIVPVEDNIAYLCDKEGNRTGALGIIRDITERKKAEIELKKSDEEIKNLNKQIEFILGATKTGIDIIDSDFNIQYIDSEWRKIYGDPADRKCYEYFMDRSEVCPGCGILKALATKASTITEEVLVKENNRPIQVTTIPYQNEKGEWLVAEVNVDITERKQAEDVLKKSEERYQKLIENANDAIISINREGMIIGFNKKAEEIFGYAREEMMGKPSYLLAPPQVRENQKKILKRWRETGCIDIDGKLIEGKGLKKDGKEFPAEFSYYLLKHYGEVINTAIVRDITERKIAEQRLIEYQNQLRSLASELTLAEEHERRRFATYLHDHIGQTLFGIHLKLDLLKQSLSTNDDIKPLKEVMNSIQQMIRDTRLLTFELSPPILHESNLESALDSLTERMHEQYGIMVTLKNDKQEKPLDDDIKIFLFQAVRELLINVVKHAHAKGVSISIQKEHTRIQIHVEDDGVGFIPSSNDFSQNQHKGFGLFSIRERLNYLGGSLEINSQPGHGTKITILSPLKIKKRRQKNRNESKLDDKLIK